MTSHQPGLLLALTCLLSTSLGSDGESRKPAGPAVGGYVQVQWMYDFHPFASPQHSFALRRGRVEFGYETDRVGAEVELGCDRLRLSVRDAWVEYRIGRPLRFVAGLRKMGFSAEELEPASRLLMVERSRTNDLLRDLNYAGRDIGLAIEGDWLARPLRLGYSLGAFNGNGDRSYKDWNNAKQFCERLTVALHDRLTIGVNATQRNDSLTGRLLAAVGVDARYRFRQVTIEAEALAGDSGTEAKFLGGFVTGAYRLGAFEPGLRVEQLWRDLSDPEGCTTVLTAACNWHFHRRALLKANLVSEVAPATERGSAFVVQAQVDF